MNINIFSPRFVARSARVNEALAIVFLSVGANLLTGVIGVDILNMDCRLGIRILGCVLVIVAGVGYLFCSWWISELREDFRSDLAEVAKELENNGSRKLKRHWITFGSALFATIGGMILFLCAGSYSQGQSLSTKGNSAEDVASAHQQRSATADSTSGVVQSHSGLPPHPKHDTNSGLNVQIPEPAGRSDVTNFNSRTNGTEFLTNEIKQHAP